MKMLLEIKTIVAKMKNSMKELELDQRLRKSPRKKKNECKAGGMENKRQMMKSLDQSRRFNIFRVEVPERESEKNIEKKIIK